MSTDMNLGPVDESQSQRGENALELREVAGLSQAQIVRRRFTRHRGAMVALGTLIFTALLSVTSIGVFGLPGWYWTGPLQRHTPPAREGGAPTMEFFGENGLIHFGPHPFGQSQIGQDIFAQVMAGVQTSLLVMLIVGAVAAVIGILAGALSGFFRGFADDLIMRATDLVITVPSIVLGAVLGAVVTNPRTMAAVWEFPVIGPVIKATPMSVMLSVALGLILWPGLARLVRGEFLSLREREFVDAARVAGASNNRIIFKHMLPNAVGVAIVNVTLLMASAVLLETSLAYLGFGITYPEISLGWMISEYQSAFSTRPWLFWWPGLFIIVIALCVNFIGDGLRDAYDPRQKRVMSKRQMVKADLASARKKAELDSSGNAGASGATATSGTSGTSGVPDESGDPGSTESGR